MKNPKVRYGNVEISDAELAPETVRELPAAGSFFVQYFSGGPVYHGEGGCTNYNTRTFKCSACKRTVCWCGGHDGAGTAACRRNCSKCDECCEG